MNDDNNFKKEIKNKFGDKISFEKCNYINKSQKCILICKKHNLEIISYPCDFLRSNYCCCKECKKEASQEKGKQLFLQKAKEIHGNKYDYSLVDYKDRLTKVKIICPIHGTFEQLPSNHIHTTLKQGCPKCGHSKASKSRLITTEEFIKKSKEINGDKYDYSKTKLLNMKTKVEIICPEHGSFFQNPDNHLRKKYGCPLCSESHGERKISKWLSDNGFTFEREKTYLDDYGPKGWPLPYDFYIPEKNILIEYQGEQHFKLIRYGGIDIEIAKNNLKKQRHYDWLKRKYAKDKKIPIVYLNYWEDISKKLDLLF